MNYKFSLLLKYVLFINFIVCSHSAFAQKIIGKIFNRSTDSSVKFFYSSGLVSKEDSANVTPAGVFARNFNFTEANYLTIQYSSYRKKIYVFPGAKIEIIFNAADQTKFNNSFIIKGDYYINRYLDSITRNNLHYKFIYSKVNISLPIDSFSLVLKEFRIFSDSLRQAFFPNAEQNKRIKALKKFLITDSINWYSYSVLSAIDYISIIPTGNKKLFRRKEIEKKLLFQSSNTYLISDYYKRIWFFFLKGEFEAQLKGADSTKVEKMGFTNFALQYIDSKHVKRQLKQLIISQLLTDILQQYTYGSSKEIKHSDSLISNLRGMLTNQAFLEEFDQLYRDNKRVLLSHQIGKKAPDFILTDTIGRRYTLKDFEGKILLIDVWASWCGPCIKEFPYLHELEKKFKNNKQFQLLSISTDDTKQIWVKNGLLRFSPPGLGLWVGKEKEFSRDYNIDLIPVLLLLDKNGNFIDFNPPRASEGNKLYQLINHQLKDL